MENSQNENRSDGSSLGEVAMSNSPESNPIPNPTTEDKVTAEQIQSDCPVELQDLAERIKVHLEKARKYKEKSNDHYITAGQYLAEAQKTCDEGGFSAFRDKYFPHLGRSRVSELLQIATKKKSIEEVRASTRQRVGRHRANKAVASVTVTDTVCPPTVPDVDPEVGDAEDTSTPPSDRVRGKPSKPARTVSTPKDMALMDFNSLAARLMQMTKNAEPRRFIKTAIDPDNLGKLGAFLSAIAKLKSESRFVPQGSAEIPLEDRKAQHDALDATDDREAA
jgi:hypothetical protein